MNYTDKELIRAAQVAYLNIGKNVFDEVYENISGSNLNNTQIHFTLLDLYNNSDTFKKSVYEGICNITELDYEKAKNYSRAELLECVDDDKKIQQISEQLDIIDDIKTGEIGKWKVVSYVDNNQLGQQGMAGRLVDGNWYHTPFSSSGDGLAAMVFETSEGNAITAFRGSEDMTNANNLLTDWIASDGGLALSDRDTSQQNSVYEYMKNYVLELGYDDITLTGHSLGGNLAMHAAVSAYGINSDKARKISNAVSFDGPGFSNGYMIRHDHEISRIKIIDKTTLTHYTWSIVGVLLDQIQSTIDLKTHVGTDDVNLGFIDRHDMSQAQYDSSGNLLPAVQDDYKATVLG